MSQTIDPLIAKSPYSTTKLTDILSMILSTPKSYTPPWVWRLTRLSRWWHPPRTISTKFWVNSRIVSCANGTVLWSYLTQFNYFAFSSAFHSMSNVIDLPDYLLFDYWGSHDPPYPCPYPSRPHLVNNALSYARYGGLPPVPNRQF